LACIVIFGFVEPLGAALHHFQMAGNVEEFALTFFDKVPTIEAVNFDRRFRHFVLRLPHFVDARLYDAASVFIQGECQEIFGMIAARVEQERFFVNFGPWLSSPP
jgi:hypothetical protein